MKTFNTTDLDRYMIEAEPIAKVLPASVWSDEIEQRLNLGNVLQGATMPWAKTHDQFRFRANEVTLWQGINGHGKSQVLGQVCIGLMAQNERVCIASFEMKPVATYMRMLRQVSMTDKPTKEYSDKFLNWLDDKLWIYDHLGSVAADRVYAAIRYAAKELNVKHFVIDNLMKCVKGEEDYTGQKDFVDNVCRLAREHDMHIHLVHHVRKGASEEGIPGKFDSRGSGTITDQVDNILTVWRNKRKEQKMRNPLTAIDPELLAQGDAIIQCDKHRHGEWEGRIKLWFHAPSLQYVANESGRPFEMVRL